MWRVAHLAVDCVRNIFWSISLIKVSTYLVVCPIIWGFEVLQIKFWIEIGLCLSLSVTSATQTKSATPLRASISVIPRCSSVT